MELPFHSGALSAFLTGGVGLIPELTVTHFAIKEAVCQEFWVFLPF